MNDPDPPGASGPEEREVFQAALDMEAGPEREAFLDQACSGNVHLRRRISKLLSVNLESSFLETSAALNQMRDAALGTMQESGSTSHLDSAEHYEVGPEIARGGMGSIREALDTKLDRTVAIKVLHSNSGVGDSAQTRFVNEARVLARLAHPNIVPIHDIVREDGQLFYSMKLVKGRTLQQIISDLLNEDAEALRIHSLTSLLTVFQKVCDAMAFAHSKGVIHRDLKPENIMVGEFGEVLVMDWGLAKIFDPEASGMQGAGEAESEASHHSLPPLMNSPGITIHGSVMGTPQYMSPEQASGANDELDERSDIFSLGGILYAILTLRAPVEGKTPQEVLEKVKSGHITSPSELASGSTSAGQARPKQTIAEAKTIKPLPHTEKGRVPSALSSVAMKALSHPKTGRYQLVRELSEDIERFQTGFATRAEEAGPAKQMSLLIRRNKGFFGTAAAALTLLLGATIWFVVNLQAKEQRAVSSEREAIAEKEAAILTLSDSYLNSGVHEFERGNAARAALWFAEASLIDPPGSERATLNRGRAAEFSRAANVPVRALRGSSYKTFVLSFSHDNRYLLRATHKDDFEFFDLENERRSDALGSFTSAAFVNNPPRVVLSRAPGEIEFLHLGTFAAAGKVSLGSGIGEIAALGVSEDSQHLFIGGRESCTMWDLAKGEVVDKNLPAFPVEALTCVGVARGGRQVCASFGKGLLLDLAKPAAGWVSLNSHGEADRFAYAFPRSRQTLFPGRESRLDSLDPVVPDGYHQAAPLGQRSMADAIIASPDGSLVARTNRSGVIFIMRINAPSRRWIIPSTGNSSIRPIMDRSGARLTTVSRRLGGQSGYSITRVHDLASALPAGPELNTGKTILDADFSPDGNVLAFACGHLERTRETMASPTEAGEIQFWDWRTATPIGASLSMPSEPRSIRFHPSGEWAAVVCAGHHVMRIEFPGGEVSELFHNTDREPHYGMNYFPAYGGPGRLRFSQDGKYLMVWDIGRKIFVWDTEKNGFHLPQIKLGNGPNSVDIRGDLLLSTGLHEHAKEGWIRNLHTGEIVPGNLTQRVGIPSGTFNQSGDTLVLAGLGSNLAVHRVAEGFPLACPDPTLQAGAWSEAAFLDPSPLIMVIGSANPASFSQIFDHRTGRPYTPTFSRLEKSRPTYLTVAAGGNYAAACWSGLGVIVHDLRELGRGFDNFSPEDLRLLSEINALAQVGEGALVKLSEAQWIERWEEFRRRHPDYHALNWTDEMLELHHRNRMLEMRADQKQHAANWHQRKLEALQQ